MSNIDFKKGIHFKCQGSSKCCVSRGIYGYVYLSKKDIARLSNYIDLNVKDFIFYNLKCGSLNTYPLIKINKITTYYTCTRFHT